MTYHDGGAVFATVEVGETSLGAEGDRTLQLVREDRAQLVLRGEHRDPTTRCLRSREDRAHPQELGRVHHHLVPRLGVEEEVAADPMHRGRRPRHDRRVVDVRIRGQTSRAETSEALVREALEVGHDARLDRGVEIGLGAAVDADHGDGYGAEFSPTT